MRPTVLFVGQAPGRRSLFPFMGKSGHALARLLGVQYADMFDRFGLMNIVEEWQGKQGKGDRFDVRGLACRESVTENAAAFRGIVLCGKRVAKACQIDAEYLDVFDFDGKKAMILPHPSGVNRWWNDADDARRARKRLRTFVSRMGKAA